MGSYVPATKATIGIVDAIFTRFTKLVKSKETSFHFWTSRLIECVSNCFQNGRFGWAFQRSKHFHGGVARGCKNCGESDSQFTGDTGWDRKGNEHSWWCCYCLRHVEALCHWGQCIFRFLLVRTTEPNSLLPPPPPALLASPEPTTPSLLEQDMELRDKVAQVIRLLNDLLFPLQSARNRKFRTRPTRKKPQGLFASWSWVWGVISQEQVLCSWPWWPICTWASTLS